ncbi:pyridoxal phosphate-dependent transferase [Fimicolochytrium jonesii]|uniref:pyridoxal phosphate-dependent transferase n=1 Tax=Fimicolochytrium jonesii TaxID=1396493 RepID=UPI0022FEC6A3|nr:pyridoxal phosphate-dependent transferase [Fimicolochytrium jonesii]KAI8815865.1 pyridoxal phosphate-dependent transferase [Fimicolochytrium jonesii]
MLSRLHSSLPKSIFKTALPKPTIATHISRQFTNMSATNQLYGSGSARPNDQQPARKILADFRSDTVTTPSRAMREAMLTAEVGDDVFGEDPTINELQRKVAEMTGHEDALFLPTATMSNQIAVRTHLTCPPYSVICDHRAHVFNYEAGGISYLTGAQLVPVTPLPDHPHLTAAAITPHLVLDDDVHHTPTRLICMENTLNGEVVPIENIREVTALARGKGVRTHLDGARLWHASVKTGIELREYCGHFDSVTLCFSKALGAPVGSTLVGSKAFIKKARHFRKMFGGGMRQAGLLASACLHALSHTLPTLHQTHAIATSLATRITSLGLPLTKSPDTNMVWFESPVSADELKVLLEAEGVRIFGGVGREVRLVVHWQVGEEGVEAVVRVLEGLVKREGTK